MSKLYVVTMHVSIHQTASDESTKLALAEDIRETMDRAGLVASDIDVHPAGAVEIRTAKPRTPNPIIAGARAEAERQNAGAKVTRRPKVYFCRIVRSAATPPPNGDRQVPHIVAAANATDAAVALGITSADLRNCGGPGQTDATNMNAINAAGFALAMSEPGRVFWLDEHGDGQWRPLPKGRGK